MTTTKKASPLTDTTDKPDGKLSTAEGVSSPAELMNFSLVAYFEKHQNGYSKHKVNKMSTRIDSLEISISEILSTPIAPSSTSTPSLSAGPTSATSTSSGLASAPADGSAP
ncbi:hypothetical protein [Phaffia rhodozyma]|uniref:Uncharacterized protein n=1 Tax=Phaffia rhodozyma TaxID=264483 RepID=A0A0F7SSP7_PHARH|nr:hypothetical protein [Phaffia rhodozyma]